MAGGAPASATFDAIDTVNEFFAGTDKSTPKWLAGLPLPKIAKDVLKAYDISMNGPTTTTGVSTGKPPPLIDSIVQSMGVRTRSQARPFEQGSAAQYRAKQSEDADKAAIVRRVLAGGMGRANARMINEWNKAHPDNRITAKGIQQSRKRRTKMEREIREQNLAVE
jgi:hypothetical protein